MLLDGFWDLSEAVDRLREIYEPIYRQPVTAESPCDAIGLIGEAVFDRLPRKEQGLLIAPLQLEEKVTLPQLAPVFNRSWTSWIALAGGDASHWLDFVENHGLITPARATEIKATPCYRIAAAREEVFEDIVFDPEEGPFYQTLVNLNPPKED